MSEELLLCPRTPTPPMTLRDWFAGQAATGLLAQTPNRISAATVAEEAYMLADAMLAARTTHPKEGQP